MITLPQCFSNEQTMVLLVNFQHLRFRKRIYEPMSKHHETPPPALMIDPLIFLKRSP